MTSVWLKKSYYHRAIYLGVSEVVFILTLYFNCVCELLLKFRAANAKNDSI